ncbi:MAG TPA: hypothetical protein VKB24_09970 [Candidatus Acidoferrum sp.]|nr:hypothetical protein [Candidatus Acidoferrum sp.]
MGAIKEKLPAWNSGKAFLILATTRGMKTNGNYVPYPNWLWQVAISRAARELYARMAWQADKDGQFTTTLATFEEWLGVTERWAIHLLDELRAAGLIVSTRHRYECTYRVVTDWAEVQKSARLRTEEKFSSRASSRTEQNFSSDLNKSSVLDEQKFSSGNSDGHGACPAREACSETRAREHSLNINTNTTPPPPVVIRGEPEQAAKAGGGGEVCLENILKALEAHGRVLSTANVSAMLVECRRHAPACTEADIVAAIGELGGSRPDKIDNPIGWILRNVPHCFRSGSYTPTKKRDPVMERYAKWRAIGKS